MDYLVRKQVGNKKLKLVLTPHTTWSCWLPYLVDVRDELPFPGGEDLLVVGSHLTLDGEEENLQVPLLCKPEQRRFVRATKEKPAALRESNTSVKADFVS